MKILLIFSTFYFSFCLVFANPVEKDCDLADELVYQVDELMRKAEFESARSLLRTALKHCSNHIEALSKMALVHSEIGVMFDDSDQRKTHFQEASRYARKAYRIDPEGGSSNFAMAIALGREIEYVSVKKKLANVDAIKRHIDIAVIDNPDNHYAIFIQGQWHYQLARLEGLLKLTAEWVLGEDTMSQANMKIALNNFQRATILWNDKIVYHLYLAKAYQELGEERQLRRELNTLKEMPEIFYRDPRNKGEALEMLSKIE